MSSNGGRRGRSERCSKPRDSQDLFGEFAARLCDERSPFHAFSYPFHILFGLFFGHFEGGEKKHVFRDGSLVLRSYEDFMENAIGGVVTRASRDLVAWALEAPISWHKQQTLELGAGCGLVSSALMHLGAAVVATDLLELVPHLEYNLSLNATGLGWRVRALNWDSKSDRLALRAELGPPDAIFAANCATAPHGAKRRLRRLQP